MQIRELFWSLRCEDGGKIDDIKTTPSAVQLKSMGIVAALDKELFTLLQDEQARDQLRGLLVDTYLSTPKLHNPKVLPLFIGMVPRQYLSYREAYNGTFQCDTGGNPFRCYQRIT